MSQVYESVVERDPREREACLAELCAGDEALWEEIESLFAQEGYGSPLDRPIWAPDVTGYNAAAPQQMPLAAGVRLGPYEIQSMLGSGGMGEVYRAVDTRLNRTVAIKILKPAVGTDPKFRARFNREARTISQLDHPGICALFDVGEERGTAFLVMPYLDGVPLSARLRQGPLPASDVVSLGIALASALTYAHGHGIIHRDIKPQNVLVLADGTVKLLDFGIAKPYGTDPSVATSDTEDSVTEWGHVPGTLEYMAPEQLAGREADVRSDVFSLGVLLFELASGSHPFRRATRALTTAAILAAQYPGLPEASAGPDKARPTAGAADLDPVLRRMLAAAPGDRYPTMADCLADLRAIDLRSSRSTSATATRTRRVPRLASIVAPTAIAVLVLGLWLVNRERKSEIPSGEPTDAVASRPIQSRVAYWLDVEAPADSKGARRRFQSAGDDVYSSGSRFRVNVQAPTGGYVYVLGDEAPGPDNPAGLALLYSASDGVATAAPGARTLTTDWFVFTGPPGRERLWLVWSKTPIEDLAAVAANVNPTRDGGVIHDVARGERIRAWLAQTVQPAPSVARDAAGVRATLESSEPRVIQKLELQHG